MSTLSALVSVGPQPRCPIKPVLVFVLTRDVLLGDIVLELLGTVNHFLMNKLIKLMFSWWTDAHLAVYDLGTPQHINAGLTKESSSYIWRLIWPWRIFGNIIFRKGICPCTVMWMFRHRFDGQVETGCPVVPLCGSVWPQNLVLYCTRCLLHCARSTSWHLVFVLVLTTLSARLSQVSFTIMMMMHYLLCAFVYWVFTL